MRGGTRNRLVAAFLLVAVIPWCLGCASEAVVPHPAASSPAGATGQLQVRVFEDSDSARHDLTVQRAVVTELYRIDGRSRTLVRRETAPRWSVSDLAPGHYELRAEGSVVENQEPTPRSAGSVRNLVIRADDTTTADVVLGGGGKRWHGVAIWVAVGAAVLTGALLQARHEVQSMHLLSDLH